jgi:Condensation domain
VVLVRLASDNYVLLLNQHHIVTDGWSAGILVEELVDRYAVGRGAAVELPALPIHYPDFAVWQRERLPGPALEPHLDYWKRELAGIEPLEFPTDCALQPHSPSLTEHDRITSSSPLVRIRLHFVMRPGRLTPFEESEYPMPLTPSS